ncbi:hypothetical protein JCM10212_002777 [Sporobolomyces blumeae]
MFHTLTSTSSARRIEPDPLAFLGTKSYVTMIKEVLPIRPSKLSPLTPSVPISSRSSTSSSSSSSSSTATFVGSSSSPSPRWGSSSTSSSSDASDDDELATPPASPRSAFLSLPAPSLVIVDRKGKGKTRVEAPHDPLIRTAEIAEDDDAVVPFASWTAPVSHPTSGPTEFVPPSRTTELSLPSLDENLYLPLPASQRPGAPKSPSLPLPKLALAPPAAAKTPPPRLPAPPPSHVTYEPLHLTRQQEERLRGRSRSPRLLWRSDLDEPAVRLLETYHERSVGRRFPRLVHGMSPTEVRDWSLRVEQAGI